MIELPSSSTYPAYFQTYINQVPEGDILGQLRSQIEDTVRYLIAIGEERSRHRYAPDRWSIREIVGHVSDAERVFCYRALSFARGDKTPLPGFEQNDWVANSNLDQRPLSQLVEEFQAVRAASVTLFEGLDAEALKRIGTANENRIVVAAFPFIIAGHELHHRQVIEERYLA